jgi:hypothetical protein
MDTFTYLKLFIFAALLMVPICVSGQDYKKIHPAISDCKSVEKILRIKACSMSEVVYENAHEKVTIYLLKSRCQKLFQERWDFPPETVVAVIVNFKQLTTLAELGIDLRTLKKFKSSDISTFYGDEKRGLDLEVTDDFVRVAEYFPVNSDTRLCSSK